MTGVLITGARAPAALHLARLLAAAGHRIVMADSVQHPIAATSRACAAFVRLPAANGDLQRYGSAVQAAITAHEIDMILPTCEEVFHLARLRAQGQMTAELFAPELTLLAAAHNKFDFVTKLQELGLSAPATRLLRSADDLDAVRSQSRDLVFKPVWSRFATDVHIRPKQIDIHPKPSRPWVAQEFVVGEEVCAYAFARQGRVCGMAAYRPVHRAGKGAGIAFDPVTDPRITEFVERFVEATGWTGQIAFDLVVCADGRVVGLECNPRATSGIHFFRKADAFANAFLGQGLVTPDVTGLQAVRSALWLYGPWQRPLAVWRDLCRARDVLVWPGDPVPLRAQLFAVKEMVGIALRHRIGLTAATTHDIAWNGDQSSI